MYDESRKLKLNRKDGMKILKGAGIAVGGALLTYITQTIPNIDFGSYTPIIVSLFSIAINAFWKTLKGE